MRRLCALLLLMVTGWLLVAPMSAAGGGEQLLPACCRRQGAHHCAGAAGMRGAGDGQASVRAAGCLLMPHHAVAVLEKSTGAGGFASLWFAARWTDFFSDGAREGYALARARRSSRAPPFFSPLSA